MIFSNQFIRVSKALASCLDNKKRQMSDLDIERLRQKHQEISMTVSDVDDYLMFSNASAFCCQLCCFIILLYWTIFFNSFVNDPVLFTSQVFWILLLSVGLTLTAAGGIIVHHYVSRVRVSLICCFLLAQVYTLCIWTVKLKLRYSLLTMICSPSFTGDIA